jgi:cell division protein FtsB
MQVKDFSFVKNKYLIAFLIFLLIVFFIDDNNLLKRFSLFQDRAVLQKEISEYDVKIKENNKKFNALETDKENLERFAREEYLMKKEGEDIYIIEDRLEE